MPSVTTTMISLSNYHTRLEVTMSWIITYDWKLVLLMGNKDMPEIATMKKRRRRGIMVKTLAS